MQGPKLMTKRMQDSYKLLKLNLVFAVTKKKKQTKKKLLTQTTSTLKL